MTTVLVALLAFASVAGAGLLGLAMHLNEERRSDESKGAITFAQGALSTLAALVLGLLVSGANTHHRTQNDRVSQIASGILMLERNLIQYGPEAAPARAALLRTAEAGAAQIWAVEGQRNMFRDDPVLFDALMMLRPADARQTYLQQQALQQLTEMSRGISALVTADDAINSRDLLIGMVVVWYALLFFAMGLFARPNVMGIAAVLVGGAAVASAVLMVVEFDRPFDGLFRISDAPLRGAIALMRGQ